jgi:hypothetical protein
VTGVVIVIVLSRELLAATTNDVIAGVMTEVAGDGQPPEAIRAIALGVFDAIGRAPCPARNGSDGVPRGLQQIDCPAVTTYRDTVASAARNSTVGAG